MTTRRSRVIALVAAIAALSAAGPAWGQPAGDTDRSGRAPAIDRLPASARTILENKRAYYLRLPSGFCIDAYRSIRVLELLREREDRKRNEELESFGILADEHGRLLQVRPREVYVLEDGRVVSAVQYSGPPTNAERVVRYEGLPDWADLDGWSATPRDTGWTLFMEIPGFPELRFVEASGEGLIRAAIEPAPEASYIDDAAQRFQDGHGGLSPTYRRTEVLVRGPFRDLNFIPGQRLSGSYLLYPSGETTAGHTPIFDLLYIEDLIPTAAELADAIEQGKAEIATYRSIKAHDQPTRKVRPNGMKGWSEPRTVKVGPPITSYRFRRTVMPIRFSAAAPPVRPATREAAPADQTAESPRDPLPAPDTLILQDGRTFQGEVVQESDESVTFAVVVGSLRQELTFKRGDVDRIERGR